MRRASDGARVPPQEGAWAASCRFEDSNETPRLAQPNAACDRSASAVAELERPFLFPCAAAPGGASPVVHGHSSLASSSDRSFSTAQRSVLGRSSPQSARAFPHAPEGVLDFSAADAAHLLTPPGGRAPGEGGPRFPLAGPNGVSPASEASLFGSGAGPAVPVAPSLLSPSFARRVLAEQRRQRQSQLSLGQVYAHLYTPGASARPSPSRRLPPVPHSSLRPVSLLSSTSGGSVASSGRSQHAPHVLGRRSSPSPALGWRAVRRSRRRLGPSSTASLPSLGSRPRTPSSGVSSVHGFSSVSPATDRDFPRYVDDSSVSLPVSLTQPAVLPSRTGPDARCDPYRRAFTPAGSPGHPLSLSSTDRVVQAFQHQAAAQLAAATVRFPASRTPSFSQAAGVSGGAVLPPSGAASLNRTAPSATHSGEEEPHEEAQDASVCPAGAGGEIWDGAPSDVSGVAASTVGEGAHEQTTDLAESAPGAVKTPEGVDAGQGPVALASRWLRKLVQGRRDASTSSGERDLPERADASKRQLPLSARAEAVSDFVPHRSCSSTSPLDPSVSHRTNGRGDARDELQRGGVWHHHVPPAKRFLTSNEAGMGMHALGYFDARADSEAWFARASTDARACRSGQERLLSVQKRRRSLDDSDYALDPWIGVPRDEESEAVAASDDRQDSDTARETGRGRLDDLSPRWSEECRGAMAIQQRERLLSPAFVRHFTSEEVAQSLEELVRIYADDDICSDAAEEGAADGLLREEREEAHAGERNLASSVASSQASFDSSNSPSTAQNRIPSSIGDGNVSRLRGSPAASAVETSQVDSEPKTAQGAAGRGESPDANAEKAEPAGTSFALSGAAQTPPAESRVEGSSRALVGVGPSQGEGKIGSAGTPAGELSEAPKHAETTRRKDISQTERGGLLFAFNASVLGHREKLESFVFLLNVLRQLKAVLSSYRQPVCGPDSGRLAFATAPTPEFLSALSLGHLDFRLHNAKVKHEGKMAASRFWREQAALSASALSEAQTHAGWSGMWRLLPRDARLALGRAVERARCLDTETQELARTYLCLQNGDRYAEPSGVFLSPSREAQRQAVSSSDPPECCAGEPARKSKWARKNREGARVEREFFRVNRLGDGTELWRVVERAEATPSKGRSLSVEEETEGRTGVSWSSLLGYGVHGEEELKGWQLAIQTLFQQPDDSCGNRGLAADTGVAVKPHTLALVEEVEKELGGPFRSEPSVLTEDFLEILSSLFPGQTPRIECIDMLAAMLNTMDFVSLGVTEESSIGPSHPTANCSSEASETGNPALRQPLVHCVDAVHVADGILDWRSPRMQTVVLQLVQDAGLHFQRLWNRMTAASADDAPGEPAAEAYFLIPLYGHFTAYLLVFKLERLQGSKTSTQRPNSCSARGDECRCTYQVLDCVAAATGADEETQGCRAADAEALAALISTMLWTKGSLRFLKKVPEPGTLEEKVMMSVLPSRSRSCIPSMNVVLPNGSSARGVDEPGVGDLGQDARAKVALLADTGKFTPDCCGVILLFSIEAFYSGHRAGLLKPAAVSALRFLYARRILEVFVLRRSLFHSCALPVFRAAERACNVRKPIMYFDAPSPPATLRPTLYLGTGA
ncbi:conserved hypothetical protein [Neospora caninum Liverpool]|uniref:Uncharacterized protein n=1 Tax=Neospora caninum (strain Liverpool) TaxID=572307 RepID=F0VK44_NEOCL|nr:conserved hypothetical protein [Neospora caninum Liverpool]CBZ54445.1 conserved hypothetical protein [Neospora caninum Liverpool]CEL69155.1 TPA: hypothetical protein BN1204_048740 [Neospora caninum Liverpool]|eukprot:XP_003884475.1 conserved hypothetical protein [Neospora caninum Liverpool]